ncbi:carboxypeptidase-like regulatory domain-containing protein [Deinococcus sp. HMF7604]|uniref:carboxypeptidase-like regulatory domain-containing protein n=1 Tax=Deinococcus betulae TaxID=2873312 RepID=UPI001CCF602E|nr:carboxypeptidase-like regulatory domain-containing protein [Deinococcus betulae]MBZ9749852.1 carboxypeptidase-like regulatory domain-containing protein [Deinococcus betulae]
MNRILTRSIFASALTLGLCTSAHATQAVRGFITGTVVNQAGAPLPNVEVVADNTLGYNSNLITRTDAQGHYKISVNGMPTTFKVSAKTTLKYKGAQIPISLSAKGQAVVPGNVGGVVDFVLKPDTSTPYGNLGLVTVQMGVGVSSLVDYNKVVLTLTPVGKLADGSSGKPLVVRPVHLAGWFVVNVMYGTYKVTATENGQPLEVRQKGDGTILREWGSSFTGDFIKDMWAPNPALNVEIRHPETATVPDARPSANSSAASSSTASSSSSGGPTISGTLRADTDLKGAVVFACVPAGHGGEDCDEGFTRFVTVKGSGQQVSYVLNNLSPGLEYRLVAWLDQDGDGDVSDGDLLGLLNDSDDTVMAPVKNADITLKPTN